MKGQSYQLTFIGTVLIIFIAIVLFIVAVNLLVAILRFLWRKVRGEPPVLKHSSTQTGGGDMEGTTPTPAPTPIPFSHPARPEGEVGRRRMHEKVN
ncbi:hypothetical protein ACOMHN_021487 [Nucella lapillus]